MLTLFLIVLGYVSILLCWTCILAMLQSWAEVADTIWECVVIIALIILTTAAFAAGIAYFSELITRLI
jgi:hypothetical protein